MAITPETFFEEGRTIFRGRKKVTKHQKSLSSQLDIFRSFFGTWPCICLELWNRIDPLVTIDPKSRVVHLLWALLLMTNYCIENVNAALCGVDEDTFAKWAYPWIPMISNLSLELIDFERRFEGNWHYWTFAVDGIHCPIQEPRRPFWKGWFSHKFCGAGLAYEVATAVTTGLIIWVNGPFPAGRWTDPKMFKHGLAKLVRIDIERGVADAGYHHCHAWLYLPFWRSKKAMAEEAEVPRNDLHEYIRARHETINSRLHRFNVLSTIFRHGREMHSDFFHAGCVIVNLEIMHGFAPQFDIVPKPWAGEPEEQYEPIPPEPEEVYHTPY